MAHVRRALGVLALIGVLALPQVASAQSRGQRGDVVERVAELDKVLDLTDTQAAQLRAVFEAEQAARTGRRRSAAAREARRAQGQERRAEMLRQIEEILTPAQLERYQAWRASQVRDNARRGDGR
ncbi:MAG: hypothetical protein Rubg2KO_16220 [Rubricoccaceae bacterium]